MHFRPRRPQSRSNPKGPAGVPIIKGVTLSLVTPEKEVSAQNIEYRVHLHSRFTFHVSRSTLHSLLHIRHNGTAQVNPHLVGAPCPKLTPGGVFRGTPGTEINHQEPVAAQGHPTQQPNAPVGAWRRHALTPAPTNTTKTTPHKTSASLR
ncbi:MAG TPA: hypothetical protein VJ183_02465 [Chloroflexia bacterium]|nr:hypothetical protein [Chloroflexia bacterium]